MSEPKPTYAVTEWHGCYNDSWNGIIVPDAFAHPAKFARGLIHRIYAHMIERGYLAAGDSVVDPFGGIAAGAYDALLFGLHWTGCELEPRFVELGNRNIDKYRHDLRMLNGRLGTARLLQGDSRRLVEVVGGGMGAAVSSPPYDSNTVHSDGRAQERHSEKGGQLGRWGMHLNGVAVQGDYGSTPGQLGSMPSGDYAAAVSSPPFGEQQSGGGIGAALQGRGDYEITTSRPSTNVGYANQADTPGNLAALRADDAGFSAAVSSPPYADAINNSGEGPGARHDPIYHVGDNAYKQSSANGYGETPGNLGSMAGEGFEAAVSSPPYADGTIHGGSGIDETKYADKSKGRPEWSPNNNHKAMQDYGDSLGNIGNDTGETFWSAARVIIEQTYSVLRPGGYAAWVTKRFVRNKQIVEFSEQWAQLCEAAGFVRVEWIRAMLTEEHGHQLDIFGDSHPKGIKRASFFRRLYEKKYPENAIDWEDVLIMRKPL